MKQKTRSDLLRGGSQICDHFVAEKSLRSDTVRGVHMQKATETASDLTETIRSKIVSGKLISGERINESRLSEELGVSRTPVREALFRLEQEGFINSGPKRGFVVRALSAREVRELYPIVWTMEGLAVYESGQLIQLVVPDLEKINQEFSQSGRNPDKSIRLDSEWHMALLSKCPNTALVDLTESLRLRLKRYDAVYMREEDLLKTSVQHHSKIAQHLCEGEVDRAVSMLKMHWRFGMESLVVRIKQQ